jgi:hypothetical protein
MSSLPNGTSASYANLNDLLQTIRRRPALYLGQKSVLSLHAFLDGYYFARRELNLDLTPQEQIFQDFTSWLRQHFQVETGEPWSTILLTNTANEQDAFMLFFTLLDEFRQHASVTATQAPTLTNVAHSA